MQVFSHRGFHRDVPENTLAAFEAAIALGVDGIETDIRVTCDEKLILYHNPQTPDGTDIAQLTQLEISRRVGYEVPRLEEAIALTQNLGTDFCWNLELKVRDAFAITASMLKALQPTTTILFTSFWHDGIASMVNDPAVAVFDYGLLWASHPYNFDRSQWFEAYESITTLVFYQERLSPHLIKQCHQKGKRCFAYGDRTSEDRARLSQWQIDALITDEPQHL